VVHDTRFWRRRLSSLIRGGGGGGGGGSLYGGFGGLERVSHDGTPTSLFKRRRRRKSAWAAAAGCWGTYDFWQTSLYTLSLFYTILLLYLDKEDTIRYKEREKLRRSWRVIWRCLLCL